MTDFDIWGVFYDTFALQLIDANYALLQEFDKQAR